MNKQEWLDRKKGGHFSIDLFWEFFQEHNTGKEMTFAEFNQSFQMYIQMVGRVPLAKVVGFYDNKFAITKLTVIKTGQLLKEY